jgi:hypothetical protein
MAKTENADPLVVPCSICGAETEMRFGVAGGGCGIYFYCEACDEVVSAAQ